MVCVFPAQASRPLLPPCMTGTALPQPTPRGGACSLTATLPPRLPGSGCPRSPWWARCPCRTSAPRPCPWPPCLARPWWQWQRPPWQPTTGRRWQYLCKVRESCCTAIQAAAIGVLEHSQGELRYYENLTSASFSACLIMKFPKYFDFKN